MLRPLKILTDRIKSKPVAEKELVLGFKNIVGKSPGNINLYRLALRHSSNAVEKHNGFRESNERLEFLGDAILDAVISDHLFRKYPFKNEGFLTELRAKIVSRESLNNLAQKMGIPQLLKLENAKLKNHNYKSLYGNALEAIVGAVYLDRGYAFCQNFIINKLIIPYFDLNEMVSVTTNFKSKLIEWSQRENRNVKFEILEIKELNKYKEFTAQIYIDEQPVARGFGHNKKKAEQNAAFETIKSLKIE